jgi:hypothetical protein
MASPRSVTGASATQDPDLSDPEPPRFLPHDLHLLGAQRLFGRPAVERQGRRGLLVCPPLVVGERSVDRGSLGGAQLDVREADQRSAGQVGDEKRDLRGAEHLAKLTRDGLDSLDGRGRLRSGPHAVGGA